MRVGVGILGQGHTPHGGQLWRDGACFPRGVPGMRGRPEADRFLQAVSDVQREESHRPGMRALPQASRTGRGGKRPGRVRDEDLDPLPVGPGQPGPQGRRRGALIEEVPDEDTSDPRWAGRVEQRGAVQEHFDRIGLGIQRGEGEGHRVDVMGHDPCRARVEGGDAGHPAPTAQVQHRLPADPEGLGLHDARQRRVSWRRRSMGW